MKVCLTTLYDDNFSKFAPYVLKSFEKFCEYNDCDLIVHSQLLKPELHPSWNKLHVIKNAFKTHDFVIWADADSLFTNKAGSFLELNSVDESTNFMTTYDGNGICLSHGEKWEQNTLKGIQKHFNIQTQYMHEHAAVDCTYGTTPPEYFFYHYPVTANEKRYELIKAHYEHYFKQT